MILNALLNPPVVPAEILSRNRLVSLLGQGSAKVLTLVSAEAGSGKTVLLCDYIKSLNYACWLQGDELIEDPVRFLTYLNETIRLRFESFGRKLTEYLSPMYSPGGKISTDDILTVFLNDFSLSIKEKVLVVIDDYQLIQDKGGDWLDVLMNRLLAMAPPNLRFIISSREEPGFETAKLKAKRNILQITTQDLAFTEEETRELASEFYGLKAEQERIRKLHGMTSGWVTGLHMLLQLPAGEGRTEISRESESAIFDYFAGDIFSRLDESYKEFVLLSSLLRKFTADDCREILEEANTAEILTELIKKNIFIESVSSEGETLYSYQKLFSAYLRKSVSIAFSKGRIGEVLVRSAERLAKKGDIEGAIHGYIEAGQVEAAVQLVVKNFDRQFDNDNYLLLKQWFSVLGTEYHGENKELLLHYMRLSVKLSNFSAAHEARLRIESLGGFEEADARLLQYMLVKAEFEISSGNPEASVPALEEILSRQPDEVIKTGAMVLLIRAYYRLGFGFYERGIL